MEKRLFANFKTDIEDTHAFINHLLVLENIKVAVMFREDDNEVKVSLRSLGNVDVGEIARELGGGGHNHSAATIIATKGRDFDEVTSEVISLKNPRATLLKRVPKTWMFHKYQLLLNLSFPF